MTKSKLSKSLAALAAPIVVLTAAGAAHAGPAGHGLTFTQEVAWKRQHAVTVTVADVLDESRQAGAKRALRDIRGVQRVEFDAKRSAVRVVPAMHRTLDPLAVRAALSASGYRLADAG